MRTNNLDVLYILKESEDNEELKYSLRSLEEMMPHRRVFVAGYKPSWLKNVIHINTRQRSEDFKYQNAGANIRAACDDPRLSDNFILMNDDYFILRPTSFLTRYHRGELKNIIEVYRQAGSRAYLDGMIRTYEILQGLGYSNPLCYEMHMPMVINKRKRLLTFRDINNPEQKPVHSHTLYGNIWKVGGEKIADVKIYKEGQNISLASGFISTSDHTFSKGKIGVELREMFSRPSNYEMVSEATKTMMLTSSRVFFPNSAGEALLTLTNNG